MKGTEYIAREVQRFGLQPAGDNGTYFQNIPLYAYTVDSATTLKVGGRTLVNDEDYLAISRAERHVMLDGVPVVYGGVASDTTTWIPVSAAKGKIVVLSVAPTATPFRGTFFTATQRYGGAAAILVGALERVPANVREYFARFTALKGDGTPAAGPPTVFIAPAVAASLFNRASPKTLAPRAAGAAVGGMLVTHET